MKPKLKTLVTDLKDFYRKGEVIKYNPDQFTKIELILSLIELGKFGKIRVQTNYSIMELGTEVLFDVKNDKKNIHFYIPILIPDNYYSIKEKTL